MINKVSELSRRGKVLFIDTSNESARVAMIVDGEIVDNIVWLIGLAAGKEIIEKVNKMIEDRGIGLSEIDRIAVHSGPGMKSSVLRSGVTVATFLAFSCGAKIVEVKGNSKKELVGAVFAASPQSVIKPNYDRPGF